MATLLRPTTAPVGDRPPNQPPKAPPPRKARTAAECRQLEQLPNIGPSIAADLRLIGIADPQDLAGRDPYGLYRALCEHTGKRQDPCVLDTFMAATDFIGGAAPRPWWEYTARRKATYGAVLAGPERGAGCTTSTRGAAPDAASGHSGT